MDCNIVYDLVVKLMCHVCVFSSFVYFCRLRNIKRFYNITPDHVSQRVTSLTPKHLNDEPSCR